MDHLEDLNILRDQHAKMFAALIMLEEILRLHEELKGSVNNDQVRNEMIVEAIEAIKPTLREVEGSTKS